MTYQIKYQEMGDFKKSAKDKIEDWGEGLERIGQSLTDFITDMGMTGNTADSIQSYLEDIHYTLLASLQQLMTEYYEKLVLYEQGYQSKDTSQTAILTQDTFEDVLLDITEKENTFEEIHERIEEILTSINDICNITIPYGETIKETYETIEQNVTTLKNEVGEYEEEHLVDCDTIRDFINTIKGVIEGQSGTTTVSGSSLGVNAVNQEEINQLNDQNFISNYQSETTMTNPDYQKLAKRFAESVDTFGSKVTEVNSVLQKGISKLEEVNKGADVTSTAFSPDPVNLSTGNFIYDKTDLEIKGKHPFYFRRFYNALNERTGVLGKDFNHNYEINLTKNHKGIILHLEEGKEETFQPTEKGNYRPTYHSDGTLTKKEKGYTYLTKDKITYHFDEKGYYTKKETLEGDCIILSYKILENNKKQLEKVTQDNGDYFLFGYDEKGYLTTVKDHTKRNVSYQIEDNLLRKVTTPSGREYTYNYNENKKLTEVVNPRNIKTVVNQYDEKGRTTL